MAKRRKEREISMRKVREILRLGLARQLSDREIARSLCVSHITVARYIVLAEKAALTYDKVRGMDDAVLLRLLEKDKAPLKKRSYPEPDWNYIHAELKRKSVTLELLWQEYKSVYPEGYQHTQFCELYSRWREKLNPSMHQVHKAGEKMFVDYAGQTVPIHDRLTGKIRQSQVFVAVLGASNYTYSEATWDQSLQNWIGSHVRTFEYFDGVAKATIPDNLKSGVSKASFSEPLLLSYSLFTSFQN